ncbi:hypothetical protein IQ231_10535 [Cuspidothrix issatschenkoi LEGE 03284]|uniref:sacsin N-terminal ATP-binding-like domain-containing protein n=1 Tax=Cuspidothrix issatschenkoi TaxID=230752 RepID=UPI00187FAD10|nr:DUF3883 domain-containing protein [Cuspidothrix issatschenkoi]MBE9232110.1 hypothetical protein [Cuspidothrix issatschenkoi LEGE 03284]
MTDAKKFIEILNKQKSNYTSPESFQDIANSLESLSTDIYTDSKRFVYEMLQNADDASNRSGKLEIQIQIIGQYLVISHQGEKFTEIDIESICSVGDGNKKGDENKTGFKGIGFKSIFSHSDYVIINSGDYCFRFDKNYWENYWSDSWGNEQYWKNQRVDKGKEANVKIPWQIIPIWTDLPEQLAFLKNFNVSTIVKYNDIEKLHKELFDLFSNTQILLFLRSQEVKVTITKAVSFTIEKIRTGETIKLRKNGHDISEWLFISVPLDVDQLTKNIMENDIRIPKKLRQSNKTEISFAVQLEDGKIKTADRENRLIFTYLPTSVNYDFPFLVNASFLTDAGRQHLHEDLYWNIWLFQQIPIYLFRWLSELAKSKYKNEILKLIPHRFPGHSQLKLSFNEGLNKAISEIAFIPNKQGDLLKVSDAIWDKTNISEFINQNILIDYINIRRKKSFSYQSLIPNFDNLSSLIRLGLTTFDIEHLADFFKSETFVIEHKVEENFSLIIFLFEQCQKGKNADEFKQKIQDIPFIFNQNSKLCNTVNLLFGKHTKVTDEEVIHTDVLTQIKNSQQIYNWVSLIGVQEPTDSSFISLIIQEPDKFINLENAIDTIRFIFNAYKKNIITNEQFEELRKVSLLTKGGTLVSCENCYLSDFYNPDLMLEKKYSADVYVSEKYPEGKDEKTEWKAFFLKMKVKQNINKYQLDKRNISSLSVSFGKEYFDINDGYISKAFKQVGFGYGSHNQVSFVRSLSFLEQTANNQVFAKIFWENVIISGELDLTFFRQKTFLIYGIGEGYNSYITPINTTYFEWYIRNKECIPTTTGKCYKPENVFVNSTEINEIAGNYLPVFDCVHTISNELRDFFGFIPRLEFNHYLEILKNISNVTLLTLEKQKENKNKVKLIYGKLASMNLHSSEIEEIRNWGTKHKLLAQDGKTFLYSSELSIVTVKGFKAPNLAFWDENNKKVIELLKIFGVSVIDKIKPDISNPVKRQDLINKLMEILPLIVVVSIEESKSKKYWGTEYSRLHDQLNSIVFFEASEIYLSYGNAEDKQKSSSYSDGNNFYYVGKWNKPRVLDSLVEPLGKFLGIEYGERHLSVLLSDTFEEGIEYLKEKFGDNVIDLIPVELRKPPEINSVPTHLSENPEAINSNYYGDDSVTDDPELAKRYAELGKQWATKLYCSHGYEVIDSNEIGYDLVCRKAGESLKVEVKAITFNRPNIRFNETTWQQMTKYQDTYEVFIFSHEQDATKELIRIRKAGLTFHEVLSKLPKTNALYNSGEIESLIGLQLNKSEMGNDIMFKWHRLLKNASHDAIEKYEYDSATSTFHKIS